MVLPRLVYISSDNQAAGIVIVKNDFPATRAMTDDIDVDTYVVEDPHQEYAASADKIDDFLAKPVPFTDNTPAYMNVTELTAAHPDGRPFRSQGEPLVQMASAKGAEISGRLTDDGSLLEQMAEYVQTMYGDKVRVERPRLTYFSEDEQEVGVVASVYMTEEGTGLDLDPVEIGGLNFEATAAEGYEDELAELDLG